MVTMVDPPGGWAYGFPAPLKADYEQQLRDAGYPESDIPLAVAHSWYHDQPDAENPVCVGQVYTAVDKAGPGGDHTAYTESYMDRKTGKIVVNEIRIVEANPQRGEGWVKDRFTGTASDGDDGA